jgi:hypothetical protein
MKEFWNTRYAEGEFAYGTSPNHFFKEVLDTFKLKGTILLPAEGEGRNAIYAAKKGLLVHAFDISKEAQNKAFTLAKHQDVSIKYDLGDLQQLKLKDNYFDVSALIYAHFPTEIKSEYHQKIANSIKSDGLLILEGFSKNHLPLRLKNPKVGGPKNIEMLFSLEDIERDFKDFDILLLKEFEIELSEGKYHNGLAKVIRFIGRKKKL